MISKIQSTDDWNQLNFIYYSGLQVKNDGTILIYDRAQSHRYLFGDRHAHWRDEVLAAFGFLSSMTLSRVETRDLEDHMQPLSTDKLGEPPAPSPPCLGAASSEQLFLRDRFRGAFGNKTDISLSPLLGINPAREPVQRISGSSYSISVAWNGNVTITVVPFPTSLSMSSFPSWASTRAFTMDKPRPVPSWVIWALS